MQFSYFIKLTNRKMTSCVQRLRLRRWWIDPDSSLLNPSCARCIHVSMRVIGWKRLAIKTVLWMLRVEKAPSVPETPRKRGAGVEVGYKAACRMQQLYGGKSSFNNSYCERFEPQLIGCNLQASWADDRNKNVVLWTEFMLKLKLQTQTEDEWKQVKQRKSGLAVVLVWRCVESSHSEKYQPHCGRAAADQQSKIGCDNMLWRLERNVPHRRWSMSLHRDLYFHFFGLHCVKVVELNERFTSNRPDRCFPLRSGWIWQHVHLLETQLCLQFPAEHCWLSSTVIIGNMTSVLRAFSQPE